MCRDICMHIAASDPAPIAVAREDVPASALEKEREVAIAQAEGKPPAAIDKIVEGKVNKYLQTVCLLEQPFVKNPDQTIQDLLTSQIQRLGENMKVARFTRYAIGS